ncbi:MAG: hypothetical protein ACE10F_11970 [Candidatus Methylomirabilales bacterium]
MDAMIELGTTFAISRRAKRMSYHGIDKCDSCGRPLEPGQGLSGLCKACEEAKAGRVPRENDS